MPTIASLTRKVLSGAGGAYLNFTPLTPLSDAVLRQPLSALAAASGSETQIKNCNRLEHFSR